MNWYKKSITLNTPAEKDDDQFLNSSRFAVGDHVYVPISNVDGFIGVITSINAETAEIKGSYIHNNNRSGTLLTIKRNIHDLGKKEMTDMLVSVGISFEKEMQSSIPIEKIKSEISSLMFSILRSVPEREKPSVGKWSDIFLDKNYPDIHKLKLENSIKLYEFDIKTLSDNIIRDLSEIFNAAGLKFSTSMNVLHSPYQQRKYNLWISFIIE